MHSNYATARAAKAISPTATLIALLVATIPAHATLTISSKATANVNCSAGVCTATAAHATLNVTELQNLLAASNVTVAVGSAAKDIAIRATLGWTSSNALTLDAQRSIFVERAVSVAGNGGLSLTTNDGGSNGTLEFYVKGHVRFSRLSSVLTINGNIYTLAKDISSLASDIVSHQGSGHYALAKSYDASTDGTYTTAPISILGGASEGAINGLGNTISNLSINTGSGVLYVGFIGETQSTGKVESLRLANVNVQSAGANETGALVGFNQGALNFSSIDSGTVQATGGDVGGVVGQDNGTIYGAIANDSVDAVTGSYAGGLVGLSFGTISISAATGDVTTGTSGIAGGLVGFNGGVIVNTFAWGNVAVGANGYGGGEAGENYAEGGATGTIQSSYSAGLVTGGAGSFLGGFAGFNNASPPQLKYLYWDTTTSGLSNAVGSGDSDGMTGETTEELNSQTPQGLDDRYWLEEEDLNIWHLVLKYWGVSEKP